MTTTVLLVDDHPVVRSGLRAVLDAAETLQVVGEAATGEEALAWMDGRGFSLHLGLGNTQTAVSDVATQGAARAARAHEHVATVEVRLK